MSFYSHWYEQNVCSRNNNRNNSSGSSNEIYEAINPDLTAAQVTVSKFYNHSRNHSRRHSRQTSSNSENLLTIDQLSSDSIWDDWILKYISNNKQISEDMVFTKNSDNLSNIISDDDTIINNGNNNNEDESIEHWT
ncbi:21351_t:CDS:2 [Entrophospora sp. SA101]|nr:2701_t:CDS:2 [Entrophospora sp. SA101]CAJ0764543.1 21351_t:CDS:2 [Entrophospora sp. SA101]